MAATDDNRCTIGLIGLGRIGKVYARALSEAPLGSPVLAYSPHSDIVLPGVRVTHDEEEMVAALPNMTHLMIASATDTHAKWMDRAMAARVRNIFVEKPASGDPRFVEQCAVRCAAEGLRAYVGFQRPLHPIVRTAITEIRAALASADDPSAVTVELETRDAAPPPLEYAAASGGICVDMSSHDWHELATILQLPTEGEGAVAARCARITAEPGPALCGTAPSGKRVEDHLAATMHYQLPGDRAPRACVRLSRTSPNGNYHALRLRSGGRVEREWEVVSHSAPDTFVEQWGVAYAALATTFARGVVDEDFAGLAALSELVLPMHLAAAGQASLLAAKPATN